MKLDTDSSWVHPLIAIPAVLLITFVGAYKVYHTMKQVGYVGDAQASSEMSK